MEKGQIRIYEANERFKEGFFKTWYLMLLNILNSKDLIIQLFKKDFFKVYKKSFVGVSWILIGPVIGIISWVIMNSTGILNPGDVGIPYPAYVLLSTSIWSLFMGFYSSSSKTLEAGSGFITQVDFPHEALFVKQILQFLANYLISFLINIVVLLMFGVSISWMIIFFPFLILPLFFLGASIGLITGVVSIVAFDIEKFLSMGLGLLLYITPIIYSDNSNNQTLNIVIKYNPLTYLIGVVRDVMLYGKTDDLGIYLIISFLVMILFFVSLRLFYVSEEQVIEKLI